MPKSLRDTWKGFKDAMAKWEPPKTKMATDQEMKTFKKNLATVLTTFTDGFGPHLDKFESAEKKGDAKAMKEEQAKLHAIIKTYQANATKVLGTVEGADNVVVAQLGKFKKDIDSRVK
jgi:hypothetical protein